MKLIASALTLDKSGQQSELGEDRGEEGGGGRVRQGSAVSLAGFCLLLCRPGQKGGGCEPERRWGEALDEIEGLLWDWTRLLNV